MFKPIYTEDGTLYLETRAEFRAIIRDGEYVGWYDPRLAVVLD